MVKPFSICFVTLFAIASASFRNFSSTHLKSSERPSDCWSCSLGLFDSDVLGLTGDDSLFCDAFFCEDLLFLFLADL